MQRAVTTDGTYPVQARVRMHASADEVRERIPPTVGRVERVDAGSCRVVAGGNSLEGMVWHFGNLGHPFTIESPDELRDAAAAFGARVLAAADLGGRT